MVRLKFGYPFRFKFRVRISVGLGLGLCLKQRMSKMRSKRMMALMKPINQPSVAKPGGGSLTRPEGESPG